METVVDVVGNEEERVEDYDTSPQKNVDPVVYKLVRVDDSGRLVPATDDEVITVEDLLEGDKTEGGIVPNTEQTPGCSTKHGCGSDNVQFKGAEGTEQVGNIENVAGIQNVLSYRVCSEKTDPQHWETSPLTTTAGILGQSGSHENEPSNSATDTSSKPDFSLLKGEIRLDGLSVRDLQETFRATFGRETSVKDKQWLRRRIIMGLTNSCDFSTTTLIVTEKKVVIKCEEDTFKIADQNGKRTFSDKQSEVHSDANVMKTENSTVQDNNASKDENTEGRPAKRVRKPTRRYIEEFSEGESSAEPVSSVRHTTRDQPSAVVCTRPIHNMGLDVRFFTRKDLLGSSGVQVPYVSRIRRSRPRESFVTLSKIQPSGIDMSRAGLIKNDVASSKKLDEGSGNKILGANSSPGRIQDPRVTFSERNKLYTEQKATELEKEVELESMESCKNSSDEEVVTFPTANGGMRRKHHRPWSISEVVKLVEGVTKYGVGRWSEIKRLAFASYSYRTPVDLKDKWRNLLRASVAEVPGRNQTQSSRKQASVPIPAPILSRVRELADIHQTQAPLSLCSSKLSGCNNSNKILHAGFL